MSRRRKALDPAEYAGMVESKIRRQTGRVVSVYRSRDAGIEDDPELPWATVCEDHGILVLHPTRLLAASHAVDPLGWCEECREEEREGE